LSQKEIEHQRVDIDDSVIYQELKSCLKWQGWPSTLLGCSFTTLPVKISRGRLH